MISWAQVPRAGLRECQRMRIVCSLPVRRNPLHDNRTLSLLFRRRKCGSQGRNRTTDTRVFSIGLKCSASFLIVPNSLIQIAFCLVMHPFSIWICRFGLVLFSAYLHGYYTQQNPIRPALPPPCHGEFLRLHRYNGAALQSLSRR